MIQELKFDTNAIAKNYPIIPLEITLKNNIFFHGTSSVNENSIERQGLIYQNNGKIEYWTKRAVEVMEAIEQYQIIAKGEQKIRYEIFHACRLRLEGFALTAFNNNPIGAYGKGISISLQPYSALLYASKSAIGGENLFSIGLFINEFDDFLQHFEARRNSAIQKYLKSKAHYIEDMWSENDIIPFEFIEFKKALEFRKQFVEAEKTIDKITQLHKYGIIYILSIPDNSVDKMSADYSHYFIDKVPLSDILYKMKVPIDYEHKQDIAPEEHELYNEKSQYWRDKVKKGL